MPKCRLMYQCTCSGQAYVGAFLRVSTSAGSGLDGMLKSEGPESSSSGWPSGMSSSDGINASSEPGESAEESELQDAAASADSTSGIAGPNHSSSSVSVKDSDIHQTGTFCQVHHISELEGGQAQLLLLGHRRLRRLHTVRTSQSPWMPLCSAHLCLQQPHASQWLRFMKLDAIQVQLPLLGDAPLGSFPHYVAPMAQMCISASHQATALQARCSGCHSMAVGTASLTNHVPDL